MYDIYKLIDPRNNTPFYIGFSLDKDKRFRQHLNEKNTKNHKKVHKLKELIELGYTIKDISILVDTRSSPSLAKKLEIELISTIGRQDLGTGPLFNLTKGGDGHVMLGEKNGMYGKISPFKGRTHTEENKKIISEAQKKAWKGKTFEEKMGKETVEKMRKLSKEARLGSKHTPETLEKMRDAQLGKKATEEQRLTRKNRMLSNPTNINKYKLISPEGEEYITATTLKDLCHELNIKYKINLNVKSFQTLVRANKSITNYSTSSIKGWQIFKI